MNGKRLQKLREERGLTRKELAKPIYVTEWYIQSWEQGWYFQAPTSGEIEGMAEVLGMDEDGFRREIDHPEEDDDDYTVEEDNF